MYERATPKVLEEARERFLEAERSFLEQRRNGSLAQALGEPLPGESPEELWWLIGEEAWYKHVDELSLEDRPYRIEAESARRAWLMQRLTEEAEDTGQRQL